MAVVAAGTAMLLLSCEGGILGGLYDEPEPVSEYGFIRKETSTGHGEIYINTSGYTYWVYLDFLNAEADSVNIISHDEEPDSWDIAVHRYDTKTNGGAVAMTSFADIDYFAESGHVPEDNEFIEDIMTEDVIAVDMSGMMDGNIIYVSDFYNPELSEWLDVDTSVMPPIYTRSDHVFILRLSDGRHVALKLENHMDNHGVKGYMTILYRTLETPDNGK